MFLQNNEQQWVCSLLMIAVRKNFVRDLKMVMNPNDGHVVVNISMYYILLLQVLS